MASLDVISLCTSIPRDLAIKSVIDACLDSKTEFPISMSALEELISFCFFNNYFVFYWYFLQSAKGNAYGILFVCQNRRNSHAEN